MAQRLRSVIPVLTRVTVCLALLGFGVAVFALLVRTRADIEKVAEPNPPLRVETIRLEPVRVVREWVGFGTAQAMDVANVAAEVAGLVTRVAGDLRPGRFVEVGTLLVTLDDTDYAHDLSLARQSVIRAESQLQALAIERSRLTEQLDLAVTEAMLARQEYERVVASCEAGAANQVEVDRSRADAARAERIESQIRERVEQLGPTEARLNADLQSERERQSLALRNVDRCSIRSPLRGQVEAVMVDEGDRVGPGTPLVQIVSLDRMEVPLQFPLSARQELAVGDTVELQAEGAISPCWTAQLGRLAPVARADSRTLVAFAELLQPEEASQVYGQTDDLIAPPPDVPSLLVPGQFVRARARSRRERVALVVPRRALSGDAVYVMNGRGQAELRNVTIAFHVTEDFEQLGVPDSEWAVLEDESDVKPGDLVILTNIENLKSGAEVIAGRINGRAVNDASNTTRSNGPNPGFVAGDVGSG